MAKSHKNSACFPGMSRLLLCKGSPQTHPSDQITEPNTTPIICHRLNKDLKHEDVPKNDALISTTTTVTGPGIVARLMGLDSSPNTNWVLKEDRKSSPDLVTRSRSVNFMDYLLQYDRPQAQRHRRVNTSVSFREVPALMNQEYQNQGVVVLCLEKDNAEKTSKKTGSRWRKSEVGVEEIKEKKEEKNNNKVKVCNSKKPRNGFKNDGPRKACDKQLSRIGGNSRAAQVSSGNDLGRNKKERTCNSKAKRAGKSMNYQKEELVESKLMKRIKKIQQATSECSSEDSNPVSILDPNEYIPIQGEMRLSEINLSPKTLSIHVEAKQLKENEYDEEREYYMQVVEKLCRLTEEDIKESKWMAKDGLDVEEICSKFGQQILDVQVKHVVEELVGFHLKLFIDGKVF